MHAHVENVVMCASPGSEVKKGERPSPGCVQPGTVLVKLGTEYIEFCEECALKREQAKG